MDPSLLIRTARRAAGLSMRELARRAHTSHSAVHAYEHGTREPTVAVFERLLSAAGFCAEVRLHRVDNPEPSRANRILIDVLELGEAIPWRPAARDMSFPRFPA